MANLEAPQWQNTDSPSSPSPSSPSPSPSPLPLEASYPPSSPYASSPTTLPPLYRNHSGVPAPSDSSSEPSRRRPSRLNSSASGHSRAYRAAVPPADETTVLAARNDPRSYAATATMTNHESIREDVKKKSAGWFGRFGAIELENKGSVARDHLALERTFLAWLRTSLAFSSIGIAITQLFRLNATVITTPNPSDAGYSALRHMGKPLGATFIGISILVLMIGVNRYYESQTWLLRGKFPASRGSIFLLTLIACLLIITTLIIILVVQPENYEL